MRTYRDELEAAMGRAEALERELARARDAGEQLAKAQAELARTQSELARLRAASGETPTEVPAANRTAVRVSVVAALLAVGATGAAGYRSESYGMVMSYPAALAIGFALGAYLARRRTLAVCLGAGAGCAAALFGALAVFYASIWLAL